MKKVYLILAAAVGMTITSCTNNEYIGDVAQANLATAGDGSIQFGFEMKNPTRADQTGADAALKLSNQFIVWGEKNETDGTAAAAGNLVFKNYLVQYGENTAYTSTSNTKNWEYVGVPPFYGGTSFVAPNSGAGAQTIKYWDYGAASYTFTAVSATQTDIAAGNVKFTKIESGSTVYDKGYTITLEGVADKSKIYIADRQPITASANMDRNEPNKYGGNVTLNFRNILSQVRVGMYETISGYKVTINKFYVEDNATSSFASMTTPVTGNFAANVPNQKANTNATLTVKYSSDPATLNQPTISVSGTKNNYIELGTNLKAGTDLNTAVWNPTYDQALGAYTSVYSQEANERGLKLKIDYTLTSLDGSGETIDVTGATAEIPSQYVCWKPNYKYTYLFKISENTNGSTGEGVVGLYPITFDATVVVAEDGLAEYITTVSEPSITTFGVVGGKYTDASTTGHGDSGTSYDYPAGADVYAVVEDGTGMATLSASNMKLYTVTTKDAANFPITEASFAEALIEKPTLTKAQVDLAKITFTAGPALNYQNTVPGEDGTTITLDNSANKAAKFTSVAGTTYALVYEDTPATYSVDAGNTYATLVDFNAAGILYQDVSCTTLATSTYYEGHPGEKYYKRTAVDNKGKYAVKVIRIQ